MTNYYRNDFVTTDATSHTLCSTLNAVLDVAFVVSISGRNAEAGGVANIYQEGVVVSGELTFAEDHQVIVDTSLEGIGWEVAINSETGSLNVSVAGLQGVEVEWFAQIEVTSNE